MSKPSMIARSLRVAPIAAVALLVMAGPGYADDTNARAQEHERQMMQGKDHAGAQEATHRGEDAAKVQEKAEAHERQMKQGKDHAASQQAGHRRSDPAKVRARAKEHERQMMKGKDHAAAQQSTDALRGGEKAEGK